MGNKAGQVIVGESVVDGILVLAGRRHRLQQAEQEADRSAGGQRYVGVRETPNKSGDRACVAHLAITPVADGAERRDSMSAFMAANAGRQLSSSTQDLRPA